MILWVSTMLVAQEHGAAEAFTAFEQALAKAQTVRVTFKGRQVVAINGAEPARFEFSGELLQKGANKVRYRLVTGTQEILMASDGATLRVGPAGASRQREAPADLRARFLDPSAARVGLVGVLAIPTGYAGKDVEDRRTAFTCSDFKFLEPEGKLNRVRYTVKASPAGRTYEATVSLDPATGLPRQRTLVGQDARAKSVVTESYEPWVLGEDIGDDAFALPGAK